MVGFCYLKKFSLLPLGTSHDTLPPIQFILPFYIQVEVIPVPVFYRLDHIPYFYFPF